MNDPNKFDRIARRKLDEREFAFDEAQWAVVERSLLSGRERSRKSIWLFALVALLFSGVATWWVLHDGSRSSVAEASPATLTEQRIGGDHGNAATPITNEMGAKDASSSTQRSTATSGSPSTLSTRSDPHSAATDRDLSRTPDGSPKTRPRSARTMKVETDVSVGQAMDHRADDRAEQTPAATSDNTRTVANNGNLEVAVGSASMEVVPDEQKAEPTKGSGGTSIISSGDVKGNVGVPPGSHELDLGIPKVSSADNTTAPARTANDTAATTQPAPQQPIALTPTKTSRIEIGLLAGGFNTMSQYSGITTANWDSDVRGKTSMGYGAELMKMGAHFGFGSGIHYSSYAERIRSNELNSNMESHSTSYYLMPVDTSFMVILGTDTIDGVVHYVTGQLHTTINTLASHTDTTNVMIRKREAHEFVNTVSYVEIPLLLDAHTRHGHWNFGVRGGPTIGLLTSRRGALPNAALDGYTDLNTEQFSSTVFGYTARIYVRYALGPAWAIGIEPTVKGQLTSTLAQSDLSRKSSAFGAFLSVTYRLP